MKMKLQLKLRGIRKPKSAASGLDTQSQDKVKGAE